jgi:hypothetical protein
MVPPIAMLRNLKEALKHTLASIFSTMLNYCQKIKIIVKHKRLKKRLNKIIRHLAAKPAF